jgi:hypothetical protein
LKYSGADAGAQAFLSDNIDRAAQKFLEVHEEPSKVQEAAAGFQVNQNIDIAQSIGIAPGSRAEEADVKGTVPGREAEYVGAFLANKIRCVHENIVCG